MIDPSNHIVQGFWTGPLTTMERLSMRSFIANGHEFHLYSYEPLEGVPDGVVLRDAAEIVPKSEMATFRCAAQFSDHFRVALLLKRGGWYTDLDNVLLCPLDFASEYVFYRDHDESTISLALSKSSAGAPFLQHCYEFVRGMSADDRSRLSWQEIGTDLVLGAIEYFKLTGYAQPGRVFDPVQWENVRSIVDPAVKFDLSQSYAVHLFHAAWNSGPVDSVGKGFDLGHRRFGDPIWTDTTYHPDCLYEQLKRRYI